MGRRKWSRADIDQLFDLRDVQQLTWRAIGEALNDNFAACCTRYFYYKDQRRLQAMRAGGDVAPKREKPPRRWSAPAAPKERRRARSAPPKAAPVVKVKSEPAPVHRPRYIHEADMDIIARIDRQGLTAGFLGDPPQGRSALDQKRS